MIEYLFLIAIEIIIEKAKSKQNNIIYLKVYDGQNKKFTWSMGSLYS